MFVSCSAFKKNIYSSKHNFEKPSIVLDTINLSGYIIYDKAENSHKFYITEKLVIIDTIKKLKKLKEDFIFIQPYEAKKYNIYTNYCDEDIEKTQLFIKNTTIRHDISWSFINNEEFIVLKNDETDKIRISFKCWKPYLLISSPRRREH